MDNEKSSPATLVNGHHFRLLIHRDYDDPDVWVLAWLFKTEKDAWDWFDSYKKIGMIAKVVETNIHLKGIQELTDPPKSELGDENKSNEEKIEELRVSMVNHAAKLRLIDEKQNEIKLGYHWKLSGRPWTGRGSWGIRVFKTEDEARSYVRCNDWYTIGYDLVEVNAHL